MDQPKSIKMQLTEYSKFKYWIELFSKIR